MARKLSNKNLIRLINPKKEGGAVILPFEKGTNKSAEREEREIRHDYEEYKALGGTIDQVEYQSVKERAADLRDVPVNSSSPEQANLMAKVAGITLSPEIVALYGILRHDEKPNPDAKEHYSTKSDQELLAEALRIVGDKRSLTALIEKHPHIFN